MESTKSQSERGFDLVNQDCFINIELKSYEATDKVVSLIEKYVAKAMKWRTKKRAQRHRQLSLSRYA
jgi:hypothetical protein